MTDYKESLNLKTIKEILNKHYVYSKVAGSRFFDVDTAAEELLKNMGDASARKDEARELEQDTLVNLPDLPSPIPIHTLIGCREAFEAFVVGDLGYLIKRRGESYDSSHTNICWKSFQKGWNSTPKSVVGIPTTEQDQEVIQREIRLITEQEIIDSLEKHAKYLHAPITGNERGLIRDIVSLCGAGLIEAEKYLKREQRKIPLFSEIHDALCDLGEIEDVTEDDGYQTEHVVIRNSLVEIMEKLRPILSEPKPKSGEEAHFDSCECCQNFSRMEKRYDHLRGFPQDEEVFNHNVATKQEDKNA